MADGRGQAEGVGLATLRRPGTGALRGTGAKFKYPSQFQPEAEAVEERGEGEDEDAEAGGAGAGAGEAGFGEMVIPITKVQEVQEGFGTFADEVGEKDVLAGDGKGFGQDGDAADIGEEIEYQPECGGDGAGPQTPGGRGVVFTDAVEAGDEQGGGGVTGNEEEGKPDAGGRGDDGVTQAGSQENAGDGDGGLGAEGAAEIDKTAEPKVVEDAVFIGGIETEKQGDATEQGRAVATEQQKDQRANKVGPADEAEDAIPIVMDGKGLEGDDVTVVFATEGEGEPDEHGQSAGAQQPGEPAPKRVGHGAFGRAARRGDFTKGEDGAEIQERDPDGGGPAHGFGVRRFVDHEDADQQQRQRADENMKNGFAKGDALEGTGAEGEGNGHADNEQEAGKDHIDEGHAAGTLGVAFTEVDHPVGDELAGSAGEVVHEDHGEHDEAAEGVDGGDAKAGGGRNFSRGTGGRGRGHEGNVRPPGPVGNIAVPEQTFY